MDRIDGIRAFVAVVDAGSFTAAAARLRISNKLVSKYVASLEAQVGATLLNRTTRSLSLTEAGTRYLEAARRVLAGIDELDAVLLQDSGELAGQLRVTAPATFGEMFIAALTADFVAEHPRLSIDLELTDRYVNLSAEGFDVAIRIGNLGDSSMIGSRIGQTEPCVVASPLYLMQHGCPETPEDLRQHDVIRDTNDSTLSRASFSRADHHVTIALQGRIAVNSAGAVTRLALEGKGIAVVPRFAVEAELRAGNLRRLLPEWHATRLDVQALHPRQLFTPPRVTAYIAHLRTRLRPALTLEPPRGS